MRGDSLTRAQIYALALNPQTGWMTRAEVRELENLPRETTPATGATGGRAGAERRAGAGDGCNERGGQVTEVTEDRKQFSADERQALADKGHALDDGSFPIESCKDVENAVRLVGHAKDPAAAKAHIRKRASALGCSLPDSWQSESRALPIGNRPEPGAVEQRDLGEVTVTGKTLHGRIPYATESRDLGGWREVISPGALRNADLSDLVATVDHAGIPIGRYPGTLTLEDRDDGCRWSVELPESRADVREAIARGDLNASSWRMKVARDEWRGDVRHVHEIRALRDVAVVVTAAYPATAASAELRSAPEGVSAANTSPEPPEEAPVPDEPEVTPQPTAGPGLTVEARSAPSDRVTRGLADEFRSRGFPGEKATMPWDDYEARALVWSGSADLLAPDTRRVAAPLGADQRYAWPAFARIGVGPEITSVPVLEQTSRALAQVSDVIRNLAATTPKPEVGTTFNLTTVSLKQLAAIQSEVPNLYLLQPGFNTTIEVDLRLTINDALDALVLAGVATAGHQAPGALLLDSIRAAIEVIAAAGYNADTLIVDPATATALDTLKATATTGEAFYVFSPGRPPRRCSRWRGGSRRRRRRRWCSTPARSAACTSARSASRDLRRMLARRTPRPSAWS